MNTQIGNYILLICSILGLYFIIAQLNPIFTQYKTIFEGMDPVVKELKKKNFKEQKKHTGNQELYFKGRAMERIQNDATGDMKWLEIVDKKKKPYEPDKSALPPNFKDPGSQEKYLNTYVHKWNAKIPDALKDIETDIKPADRKPRIGDDELPAMEYGSNIDQWKSEAGVQPLEGMTNQMSMAELQALAKANMEAQRRAAMGKQTQGRPTTSYEKKVKYTTSDKALNVTTPGANQIDTDFKKEIEVCDAINSASGGPTCDNLDGTNCGYCLDTDKAMYGDANGPIDNVCQGKHWSAPGPTAAYECTKARERRICRGVKDCGDIAGKKSICGWCPVSEEGLVKKLKGSGYDVKYPEVDGCEWKAPKYTAKWLGWGGAQPDEAMSAPPPVRSSPILDAASTIMPNTVVNAASSFMKSIQKGIAMVTGINLTGTKMVNNASNYTPF
jgi:hypothetical protein